MVLQSSIVHIFFATYMRMYIRILIKIKIIYYMRFLYRFILYTRGIKFSLYFRCILIHFEESLFTDTLILKIYGFLLKNSVANITKLTRYLTKRRDREQFVTVNNLYNI